MPESSERHTATWNQLVADVATFTERHPAPEAVAHLVWEAAVLGFVNGTQHAAGRTSAEMRADFLKDHAIVAGVRNVAELDCERWPGLRGLTGHVSTEADDA